MSDKVSTDLAFLLLRDTDETSGSGRHVPHAIALTREDGRAYIEAQPDPWNRTAQHLSWREWDGAAAYGQWQLRDLPIVTATDAERIAQRVQLRANALSKLSPEEKEVLGLTNKDLA